MLTVEQLRTLLNDPTASDAEIAYAVRSGEGEGPSTPNPGKRVYGSVTRRESGVYPVFEGPIPLRRSVHTKGLP